MVVRFDTLDRLEKPVMTLCNPGAAYNNGVLSNAIGCLSGTEAEEFVFNFNSISELNFRINKVDYDDTAKTAAANQIYSAVKNRRMIFIKALTEHPCLPNEIGFFVIKNVEEKIEGEKKYKDVQAESVDTELQQRMIPYIEDGTYRFSTDGTDIGILDKIVSTLALWSIGYVDSTIASKYRTFEDVDTNQNCLAFMIDQMQEAYECIILFDPIYRRINVYDQDTYTSNDGIQTDIHLSTDDILNSITITEGSEDLYTAMRVYGGDGEDVYISCVNPTGQNVIYDFTYYYDWMSQGLSSKLRTWTSDIAAAESTYKDLNIELSGYVDNLAELNEDKAVIELNLSICERTLGNVQASASTESLKISEEDLREVVYNGTTLYETSIDVDNQDKNELIAAINADITSLNNALLTVNAAITSAQDQVDNKSAQVQAIVAALDLSSRLSDEEEAELQNYIFEGEYKDEYALITEKMTDSDKFDQRKQMYDRAKKQLAKVSHPTQEFDVDTQGFIFSKKFIHFASELRTGCIITLDMATDSVLDDIISQEDVEEYYRAEIDNYETLMDEMKEIGADPERTIFGNIDTNNRQVIEWTDETVAEYYSELESWCYDGETPEDFIGTSSTVFGGYEEFDGLDVAFSPILQTQDGGVLLGSDTVMDYIWELIDSLSVSQQEWTDEDLIAADKVGITTEGVHIKELIAAVGSTAAVVSEAMHYTGRNGALRMATPKINEITDGYGVDFAYVVSYIKSGEYLHEPLLMFLSSITVNYDDKNMSMTFSNSYNKFDPRSLFDDVLGSVSRSANTISYIKDVIYPLKSGDIDTIKDALQNARNMTMANAVSATDQSVIIDSTGYTGRRSDGDGGFDPEQVKIVNNSIVFTDNDWETCRAALGKMTIPDQEHPGQFLTVYGLCADALIGNLVLTQNLRVENEDSTIVLDESGMTFDGLEFKKVKNTEITMDSSTSRVTIDDCTSYYECISIGSQHSSASSAFSEWFYSGYEGTSSVYVKVSGDDNYYKMSPAIISGAEFLVFNYDMTRPDGDFYFIDSTKPAIAISAPRYSDFIYKSAVWTTEEPTKVYELYTDVPTGAIVELDNDGITITEKDNMSTETSASGIYAFFAALLLKIKNMFSTSTSGLFEKVGFRVINRVRNDKSLLSADTLAFQDGTNSDNVSYYGLYGAQTNRLHVKNGAILEGGILSGDIITTSIFVDSSVTSTTINATSITSQTTHFYPADTMTIQNLNLSGDVTSSGSLMRFAVPLDRIMDSTLVDTATIVSMTFSIRGINGYIGFKDNNDVEHKPDSSNSYTLQYNSSTTYMSAALTKSTNNMLRMTLTGQNGLTHVTNNTPVTIFCNSLQISFTKSQS